jgi:predicted peroxiredoxin
MTNYVLIESRDPFESRDVRFIEETATALAARGHEVTVFLVQNGVLAARELACGSYLACMAEAGVSLLADDFSLSERGIKTSELRAAVRVSNVEALVDALLRADTKAIWH